MVNGYSETSISPIDNGLVTNSGVSVIIIRYVEVSLTEIKVTLVGIDHHIYNKSALIGTYINATDLTYGVIITYMNNNLPPHRGDITLFSIAQACVFLDVGPQFF